MNLVAAYLNTDKPFAEIKKIKRREIDLLLDTLFEKYLQCLQEGDSEIPIINGIYFASSGLNEISIIERYSFEKFKAGLYKFIAGNRMNPAPLDGKKKTVALFSPFLKDVKEINSLKRIMRKTSGADIIILLSLILNIKENIEGNELKYYIMGS